MIIDYDGSHSITFYDYRAITTTDDASMSSHTYNTWTSWHLVPTTAPTVTPYEAKISIATIPGTTKIVDLSEALAGNVLKGRRFGEWEFILDTERAHKTPWQLYYQIRNAIHGKWVLVILDDASTHSYTGRIVISDFSIDSSYAKIKFKYNLGAAKSAKISTGRVEVNAN